MSPSVLLKRIELYASLTALTALTAVRVDTLLPRPRDIAQ